MIRRKGPRFAAGRASDGAPVASWGRRALSGGLALLLSVAGFTAAATAPANAAPGSPGTPQAANVLYEEDFENVTNGSMTLLPSYTSASGLQYQAENAWLINCNGVVLDATSVGNAPNCGIITDRLRTLSRAFGIFNSDPNPALNHSLSAYTDNGSGGAADPGPNLIQFATTTPITLPPHEGKRYLGFSVDGAVDNYNSNPPQYQFYFVQGGVETPIGSPINGGTDPRGTVLSVDGRGIRVGSYATNAAVAVTGNSVGLALRNLVGTGGGNDGAIDNIRILDMTPQLDKSFSPAMVLSGGSSTLTFTVTNTSELGAKTGWSFVDNLPAGLSVVPSTAATTCANGTVNAPGGATSITVAGDLLQGQSSCTITVDVTSPVSGSFTNGPDNIVGDGVNDPGTSTVDFVSPAIALTKTASTASVDAAGQTITYTYSVTNTGDIALAGISIDESSFTGTGTPPSVVCPPGAASLAPGATVDCTAVYSVTQTDVDAGQPIVNTATASGTPPVGGPAVSEPSTASVQVDDAPAVALVKSATPNDAASFTVGQVITFSFVVTNTGNVTLTDPQVDETQFDGAGAISAIDCPAGVSLAPGAQTTCTATYTLLQADVDAGSISNEATATATTPSGSTVDSPPSSVFLPADAAPSIGLAKAADTTAFQNPPRVGDVITYRFTATNTGNVTLHDVAIADPLPGLSALTYDWPGVPGDLGPGQAVIATATYAITQADVDAGHVANSALASATPPIGPGIESPPAETDTAITTGPQLILDKTADDSAVQDPAQPGDVITYRFTATNTGNVTLTGVEITDVLPGLSGLTYDWPGVVGVLQPGDTVTATATYALVLADIDAGHVANSATAAGTPPSGPAVSSVPSETDTPLATAPALTLAKTADTSALSDPVLAGDVVTYSFTATNTGNVTLTGVSIVDALSGLSSLTYDWPGVPGTLAPGDVVTATATYALLQSNIDAGHVANSALASGTPPTGPGVESPPAETDTTLEAAPAITLDKTADSSGLQNPAQVGDVITYTFTATNTGNVALAGVEVTDVLPGLSELVYEWPGNEGVLFPSDVVTATATYEITQADIDAGHVANSATAAGTPPGGPSVSSVPSETDTLLETAPGLTLAKSADTSAFADPVQAGDVVTYSFSATNTGNVTLTGVEITDPLPGLSSVTYDWPGSTGVLAPGETVTATATYALLQTDIDSGHLANSATATGTPPTGPDVESPPADTDTTLEAAPAIELVKTADDSAVQDPAQVGDVITYMFTATNTGNVTLAGVAITDALPGLSAVDYEWPGVDGVLEPGDSVTATATYDITQSDIDAGHVANSATAAGSPPSGPDVSSVPSETDTLLETAPALALAKTADTSSFSDPVQAGDVVTYSFSATNTGNVTLTGVEIVDPLPGLSSLTYDWPGSVGVLVPGDVVTATATYALLQSDIDSGHLANSATASGTPPTGPEVESPPADTDTTLEAAPAMSFAKTADSSGLQDPAQVGDVITYTFTATNTGNVTLTGVEITDALPGLSALTYEWPGDQGVLLPTDVVTATATYEITQADINGGHIANAANVTGTPPTGPPVTTPESETDTPLPTVASLAVVKSVSPATASRAGDVVTYSFVVTNTGTVTITDLSIDDTTFSGTNPLPTATCPVGPLAPGAEATCSSSYTVSQEDVDAGTVTNTATATGLDPLGAEVTSVPSGADLVIAPMPALSLVKSASPSDPDEYRAGQVITYSFVVTNTGNVTIADVAVDEATFTGTGPIADVTCPSGAASLAPGDQVQCTTTYTLTQADVDAGSLTNSATATGAPPTGEPVVSEQSEVTIPSTPRPELALVKTADLSSITARGQLITYSFAITNVGNVTVNDVIVDEVEFTGSGALSAIQCPGEASALAPGMTITCTATYRVTALDLTGGPLSNSATASGTTLGGAPVSSPTSTAVVTVNVSPAPPKLPDTGAVLSWSLMLSALGLLLTGGVLRLVRRKEAS